MKFLIFIALLSAIIVIKSANSMSIGNFLQNPLNRLTSSIDDPLLLHGRKFQQPELVHISIRRLADEDEMSSTDPEGRQIPVISDIERIKKVVEIIEFVGEKVGELIDKIDVPTSDYNEDERKATENPQGIETP